MHVPHDWLVVFVVILSDCTMFDCMDDTPKLYTYMRHQEDQIHWLRVA